MKKLFAIVILLLLSTSAFAQVPNDLDLPFDMPNGKDIGKPVPKAPPEDTEIEEDPPSFYGSPIPSENLTLCYVVDISCSMGIHVSQYIDENGNLVPAPGQRNKNRLDRAKAELIRSVRALPRSFKFNIVAYGCSIQTFTGSAALVKAEQHNKTAAVNWIQGLMINGGTGTGFAVALALSNKELRSVILLTDGAPGCFGHDGMALHKRIINNANTQGAIITVFGIQATGSYRQFCMDVAADNGGSYVGL